MLATTSTLVHTRQLTATVVGLTVSLYELLREWKCALFSYIRLVLSLYWRHMCTD